MKDVIIPIELDVAGFVAAIHGFAADLEVLILEAEIRAIECHGERCDGGRWQDCRDCKPLADVIDRIRPVIEKAKPMGGRP